MHNSRFDLNGLNAEAPFQTSLSSIFRAKLHQANTSVISFYDRSSDSWDESSHSDFYRSAATLSAQMSAKNVSAFDYVVVATTSPKATLQAFVGAILIGAIPIVLPIRAAFDGKEVINRRIKQAIEMTGTKPLVVVESRVNRPLADVSDSPRHLVFDADEVELSQDFGWIDKCGVAELSHIQLTSGSTGAGKGVAVTHTSTLSNIESLNSRTGAGAYDVYVSWLPLYHDMGLVSQALTALVLEADLHLMSPFDFLADPVAWLRCISDKRGTISASPSFGYSLATKAAQRKDVLQLDLSSWKSAYCGGEPIVADTVRAFLRKFAACGFRSNAFTPGYGLAETTLGVAGVPTDQLWRSVFVKRDGLAQLELVELGSAPDALESSEELIEIVSSGSPGKDAEIWLEDFEGQRIDEDLRCGEVCVKGGSVTLGYLENGSLTPFPNDTVRTGDVAFIHDGDLFLVDRLKNVVIRNGQNYSSLVLERQIAQVLELPLENIVVFDQDILRGEGLTAVLEVEKDGSPEAYFSTLASEIESFEPLLESVVLVKRGSIQRTTSGKKRHSATREALANGTLRVIAERPIEPSFAPGGPIDRVIKEGELTALSPRTTDVIRIVTDSVRARGNDAPVLEQSRLQFDLDFDSLNVLELAMKLEDEFSIQLNRESVSELRTVRDVVDTVEKAQRSADSGDGLLQTLDALRQSIPQNHVIVDAVGPDRKALVEGRWLDDFASCNYLSLEDRQELRRASNEITEEWGLQRWPTRAVALARPVIDLETRIARFIGVEDVLVFPTISLLHFGILPNLVGDGAILVDSKAHKSIQEAALLARAKGAHVVTFKHGDVSDLRRKLASTQGFARRIIAVDGVYSMSGMKIDLRNLQNIATKYDAFVYVDDAHGFGVVGENPTIENPLGNRGNGIVKHFGLTYDRIVYVGGFAKAFSTPLAFVSCSSSALRAKFETSSTMVFGHAVSMNVVAQAAAGLDINEREGNELRKKIRELSLQLSEGAQELGFEITASPLPIVNVVVGTLERSIQAARILWEDGVLLTPAIFPAAPIDAGGVRFTVTASNTRDQVNTVLRSLKRLKGMLEGTAVLDLRDPATRGVVSGSPSIAQPQA